MVLFAALFIEADWSRFGALSASFGFGVWGWAFGVGSLVVHRAYHLFALLWLYSALYPWDCLCPHRLTAYRSFRGNVIGRWLLASMAFTVIAAVNDVLTARALIDTPYLIPYAFVACIWRRVRFSLAGRLFA